MLFLTITMSIERFSLKSKNDLEVILRALPEPEPDVKVFLLGGFDPSIAIKQAEQIVPDVKLGQEELGHITATLLEPTNKKILSIYKSQFREQAEPLPQRKGVYIGEAYWKVSDEISVEAKLTSVLIRDDSKQQIFAGLLGLIKKLYEEKDVNQSLSDYFRLSPFRFIKRSKIISELKKWLELERKRENILDLPPYFEEAMRYYDEVLKKDREWMHKHLGEHVAIIGNQVVGYAKKFHNLAPEIRKKFGYGPIFMPEVTIGPNITYLREINSSDSSNSFPSSQYHT